MNKSIIDKLPPQNIDAEKSLLGSVLIDRDALNKVGDHLQVEDFYNRSHQLIYEAAFALFEKREPIDLLSLSNKLEERDQLEQIGGRTYLTSLASSVPTSAHISTYAKIIQKKKTLRDLIDVSHHILDLAHNESDEVENLLDSAEKKIFAVSQKSLTKNFVSLGSTLDEAVERILKQDDGMIRGHETGYKGLDDMLGGFQRSDLIILAARPSVGKTSLAINFGLRVAKKGLPVGIFSMEMSVDQVIDRFIAAESSVSLWKLRTGNLGGDIQRITDACDTLAELPIFIDDTPSPNILQMRSMARRLQSEKGSLGLLVIDYLQLMSARKSYESPVQQVTEISRGLKGLARELNVPILALSQLSRAVEQRDGHRPKLSDLRDSGSIEQDADLVMFIHRDDKVNFENAEKQNKVNVAELIIAKHRNGPTGKIEFVIDPNSLEFKEIDKIHNEFI